MTSPAKILLLALCVTAMVAYFGDRFVDVTHKVADSRKHSAPRPGDDMAYDGEVNVAMSRDGHYWVTLEVNGTPIRFVVDTGASHIALSHKDAQAAGLAPAGLDYNRAFRTANGVSYKAMVKLDHMALESIQMYDLSASVSRRGRMDVSLLGMNFLNELSSFTVEDRNLIMKP